ncbi:phage portal protein [Peribacillus frigoritolerans]|uniref:phage portal protein n=1 Tax=Peribacillus frigoritolerans TaxID=450367 RepID=UPI002079460D|nr:phage portal protein [Peribacillus frigoritolerans]USK78964.1 phage portal protein [Peribacillus frigoritolerans]
MGIFNKFFKNSTSFDVTNVPWHPVLGGGEGLDLTTDGAMNLAIVYACVNVKANAMGKLPLHVFQKTEDGRIRVKEHPVTRLLEVRPNPHMSPFVFKSTINVHQNTHGVAYIRMQTNKSTGQIESLHLLHPPSVTVARDESGKIFYVELSMDKNKPNIYNEEEIIRLPYLMLDGFTPKSPLRVAMEQIAVMKKQQRFLNSFYENGTLSRGVLQLSGTLNKEAKDKVRQAWVEHTSGDDNMSKVAVLDQSMEFKNITIPLHEAEFISSMKWGVSDIARVFGVPAHMVGDLERSTFSNIEHQAMQFVSDVVQPTAVSWEEEMNYKLFTDFEQEQGYYVSFNMASALRGDSASRSAFYKTMLEMGVYNINEVRELEDRDKIENGDKHFVSLNHTTVDNLENYQNNRTTKGGE